MDWIVEAETQLGFEVIRELRRRIHGKVYQIDSQWSMKQKLYALVEAEWRWDTKLASPETTEDSAPQHT